MVSDDGRHVVTFDNWHAVGRGDDVVAFYSAGRQLAKYSLEQILTPQELTRVPMTVSSMWWRGDSIDLLTELDGRPVLGVWLGTFQRWLAWDVSTGRRADPAAADLARHLGEIGRAWALQRLARDDDVRADVEDDGPGGSRIAAFRYLASRRDPRDRPLVERQLAADDFSTYTTFQDERLKHFGAHSLTRAAADRALATWDGLRAAGNPQGGHHDDYFFLGTVECSIRLRASPRGGYLWVYLVPDDVVTGQWSTTRPVHWARADFSEMGWGQKAWPRSVPVRFEGVTPGRYWVKAVYDRAAPFCRRDAASPPVCRPGIGDHESTERRSVEVKAGQVVGYGRLRCESVVSAVN